MKLASLFTRHDTKLPSLGRELDAVKAGKKPLSYFASHRAFLEDGSDLGPVMRAAFDRGLCIALLPQPHHERFVDIYVYRRGEGRNAERFHAFLYTRPRSAWTPADEDRQSQLLGYSARERAAWRERDRARYVAYNTLAVYAIVETARHHIQAGDRVFFDNAESGVYPSARAKLPAGTHLIRVGVPRWPRPKLFGAPRGRITEETLTKRRAERLAAAIVAGPEVLGPRGWRAPRRRAGAGRA